MHFQTALFHFFALQAAAWTIQCDADDCSDTALHQRAAKGSSSSLSPDAQYQRLEGQEIARLRKAGATLKGPKTCPQGQVLEFQDHNTVVCKQSLANASASGAATAKHSGTKTATGMITRTRKGGPTHKATGRGTATRKLATHKATYNAKATHTQKTKASQPKPTQKAKARPTKGGKGN